MQKNLIAKLAIPFLVALFLAPLDMCPCVGSFLAQEILFLLGFLLFIERGRFRESCQPLIKVYVPDLETISHEKLISEKIKERKMAKKKKLSLIVMAKEEAKLSSVDG